MTTEEEKHPGVSISPHPSPDQQEMKTALKTLLKGGDVAQSDPEDRNSQTTKDAAIKEVLNSGRSSSDEDRPEEAKSPQNLITRAKPTDQEQDTSPPKSPAKSESLSPRSEPIPSPESPAQNGGRTKRPAPLRMTSGAGKRQRSGSSEHKIPLEHQRSLREFYEAGGRDYKDYLSWLSAMAASGEKGNPPPCDGRKGETDVAAKRRSPSQLRLAEPGKVLNVMPNRISDQQPHKDQRCVNSSLGGVTFGQHNVPDDKTSGPEPTDDAVVLDLSYRGPAPHTKQKLFELLSTKAGKRPGYPCQDNNIGGEKKEGLLYDTSKVSPLFTLPHGTSKHTSLMAKLLTDTSPFSREEMANNGHRPIVVGPNKDGTPSPPGQRINPRSDEVHRDVNGNVSGKDLHSRVEGEQNGLHVPLVSVQIQGDSERSAFQPVPQSYQPQERLAPGSTAPPPLKKRRSSPSNLDGNDRERDGDGKSEQPKAVWPFLEEIIVRSLARSPPTRSLCKKPREGERDRGGPAGRGGARSRPQHHVIAPVSQGHVSMPVSVPMAPVLTMAPPPCPPRPPSGDPPMLTPQHPIPVYPVMTDPGRARPVVTPPDLSHMSKTTPRTEECTSASDRDLLSWDIEQVVNFVGSLPKCQDYAEVFREQEIDGLALSQLNEDHLVRFFQMRLGPAIRLRLAVTSKLKDMQR